MTTIHFHSAPLDRLKTSAREQLPTIKHGHILEALARALNFNSWASLSIQVKHAHPYVSVEQADFREVSIEALRSRLVEMGYEEVSSAPISFAAIENGSDILGAVPDRTVDLTRDRDAMTAAVSSWDLSERARRLLVEMIVSRAPGTDQTADMKSKLSERAINILIGAPSGLSERQRFLSKEVKGRRLPLELQELLDAMLHFNPDDQGNSSQGFPIVQSVDIDLRAARVWYAFSPMLRTVLLAGARAGKGSEGPSKLAG